MISRKNIKMLSAIVSASLIMGAVPFPAVAAENETEETTEVLTTETSASTVILTDPGDNSITLSDSCKKAVISENGLYTLSGEASGAAVSVEKGITVTLEISDLSIDNSGDDELIFLESGKGSQVNIVLTGDAAIKGGKNAFKTGKGSTFDFSGDGSLLIEGTGDDAIKAKNGTVSISEGTITITECGGDGIQAENVEISGGILNIDTWYQNAATGYYSGSAYSDGSDTSVNYLWESGDSIKYERVNVDTGSHKGIKAGSKAKTISFADGSGDITEEASGSLKISGGRITIDTTKSGLKANSLSTGGYTAAKTGTYIIGAPDDAISCNNDMEISGGIIDISSSDDGISAMGELDISGNAGITINTSYEGIEAQTVIIGKDDASDDPVITINSADDGINTSGKTLTYTYDSYEGYEADDEINYTKKSVSSSSGNDVTVNSGTVTVNIDSEGTKTASLPDGSLNTLKIVSFRSSGDGIDCNGSLTQNGGELCVYGQASGDNSPIDTNSGFTFNSGSKILGTGTDGMNECSPKSGSGSYITYGNGNNSGMPGGSEMNGSTPPERPDGSSDSGSTPPEMPGGSEGSGSGSLPGSGMGNSFSAGQYWAVVDDNNRVVDLGQLKYSGSFIIYGSDLISDGSYTLTVTDSKPEAGDVLEISENGNTPDNMPGSPSDDPASGNGKDSTGDTLSSNSANGNVKTGSFSIGDLTYEYRFTDNVSYNGKKQKLGDFTVDGKNVGSTLSGNLIFKGLRYKNNKSVGEGKVIPVFKAAAGADTSVKKAVKAVNKEFKTNPLLFNISEGVLDENRIIGTAVYYSSTGKWRFSLKQMNADGTYTKLRYRTNNRGDFSVESEAPDSASPVVTISGINNYTGSATLPVTIK